MEFDYDRPGYNCCCSGNSVGGCKDRRHAGFHRPFRQYGTGLSCWRLDLRKGC